MPYLFLILTQVSVAISVICSKYLISFIPPFPLLAIRFSLATLILLVLYYLKDGKTTIRSHLEKLNQKDWMFILAQALSAGIIFNLLMLFGLSYTNANVAGIIMSALPALVAVLSLIVLKEKLSVKKCISIGLATLGLCFISSAELSASNSGHSLLGDLIILLALLPEAAYYILSKLHASKLPVFLMAGLMNGINAILMLPFIFMNTAWDVVHLSMLQWSVLILLGISSGSFYVFWYTALHKVDGITASLSTALMPVITVVVAWLTLGEVVNVAQLVGMGLVMTSIVAYTFS